jgi:2-phospho-L-lactate guanylyltransferase
VPTDRAFPNRAVLLALPLKAFAASKGRLDGLLEPPAREALSRAVAERVAAACAAAGPLVAAVTGDAAVASWAAARSLEVIAEPPGGGLDAAAAAAATTALDRGLGWCVVHADLPLLTREEVRAVLDALAPGTAVLAPSHNGGTSLLAAGTSLAFAYGPRSFSRHLAAAAHLERRVVVRLGTALDLDTPADLRAAAALPGGAWLRAFLT